MTNRKNRDDFPQRIRNAVALRASHICSFPACQRNTVGPSDESPTAVNMVGVAAHIHAAAPGGPRYLDSMMPEERSSIDNAIWLCATHATMIDGDTVTYTADALRDMKRKHEDDRRALQSASTTNSDDLVAIGPNVVFVGKLLGVDAETWTVGIHHFVEGDLPALVSFIGRFLNLAEVDRYVLVNALDDGRVLVEAPSISSDGSNQVVRCRVAPDEPRIYGSALPKTWALSDANDLTTDGHGNIATVSGMDALPQHIKSNLSLQRGESPWNRSYGTRFAEYYRMFRATLWLERYMKLEIIRLAAIPYTDSVMKHRHTPLQCVERVHAVQVLADEPTNKWLPVEVDLEIKGLGRYQQTVSVLIPDA